jgi:hypothetical protein
MIREFQHWVGHGPLELPNHEKKLRRTTARNDIWLYFVKYLLYRMIKSLCAQITPLSQHTSFLPHYLAQSDCLAADRQGQEDTRLTLTPSVIPNSVIMVKWLKLFKIFFRVFLYSNHQVHRDFLITLYKSLLRKSFTSWWKSSCGVLNSQQINKNCWTVIWLFNC